MKPWTSWRDGLAAVQLRPHCQDRRAVEDLHRDVGRCRVGGGLAMPGSADPVARVAATIGSRTKSAVQRPSKAPRRLKRRRSAGSNRNFRFARPLESRRDNPRSGLEPSARVERGRSAIRQKGWRADIGARRPPCYPRYGLVRLITRRPQLQILSFSARALMMPSMNARLFMPHSQSQAIGSLSLWPASVSRYSVFGGTC